MSDFKTEKQIEKDIYRIVSGSTLATLLKGKVYRKGMRPQNAKTEDAVVGFLSGLDDQFQTGVVNVNVYVPFKEAKTQKRPDIGRVDELEAEIRKVFEEDIEDPYYLLEVPESPQSDDLDDIEQTQINARIHYKRTTF